MAVTNPDHRKLTKTLTYMENMSFDPLYEILMRVPLVQNPVSGVLERQVSLQGNASVVLTWNDDGSLASIAKTIGETTYTKTFTWTDGSLTGVSAWS